MNIYIYIFTYIYIYIYIHVLILSATRIPPGQLMAIILQKIPNFGSEGVFWRPWGTILVTFWWLEQPNGHRC